MTSELSSQAAAHALESIQIVSSYQGGHALVAHLSWASPSNPSDASLYIRPYLGGGWTAKGAVEPSVAPNSTTTMTAQRHRDAKFGEAKLSLHHSGQTHAYVGPREKQFRLPPIQGPRLDDPSGGHIATITCFDLAGLPMLDRPLSTAGPQVDVVAPAPGEETSRLHVALFSGTDEEAMSARYPFLRSAPVLRFDRMGMEKPLFFGLRARHFPGNPQPGPGVSVMGGWGPGAQEEEAIGLVSVWVGPDEQAASGW
ncbi:hypothetical protein GCM10010121_021870 [Streptomyces brasiliensis]|uniref:Uncharacterized protein n=1 Tax=Streptomyces brasiliensis TaxID=1954 RepID=A0A917KIH6_9ACTN|nr:hypothetical protein GCM10010121_021870 [Streptomyces brasiliensis]